LLTSIKLKGVRLFAALERAHLEAVGELAKEERLPAGTVIFKEGDRSERFYFLLKGKVRISKIIPEVGEEALTILEPGDYFGEMALILGTPRSAQAIAHTEVHLAVIESFTFNELLENNKELGFEVLQSFTRTLAERLLETDEKLKAFFAMVGRF